MSMLQFINNIRAPVPGRGWEGFPGAAGAAQQGHGQAREQDSCVLAVFVHVLMIDYDPV